MLPNMSFTNTQYIELSRLISNSTKKHLFLCEITCAELPHNCLNTIIMQTVQ